LHLAAEGAIGQRDIFKSATLTVALKSSTPFLGIKEGLA
jgi:hypothetical protein